MKHPESPPNKALMFEGSLRAEILAIFQKQCLFTNKPIQLLNIGES